MEADARRGAEPPSRTAPALTAVHNERAFVAMAKTGPHRPRSPHAVADVCTLLAERGCSVRLASVDRAADAVRMFVDGVPVCVAAGPPADGASPETWHFVFNADSPATFVRVSASRVLTGAPHRFRVPRGHPHPMAAVAKDWLRLWPRAPVEWDEYAAGVLGMRAPIKKRRDIGYVDAAAIADGVAFVVREARRSR